MTRTFNTPEELMIALLQGEKWATRPEYGHYSYCNISGNFIEVLPNKVSRLISINSYRCDGKTLWHKVEDKTELDLMKEKYASGDYILMTPHHKSWIIVKKPFWDCDNYKLIHKKHKDILDAYLADNSVEILEIDTACNLEKEYVVKKFIEDYAEDGIYVLKPKKKTISLAMFTCYNKHSKEWIRVDVCESLQKFIEMYSDKSHLINHHKIKGSDYEIEIDDE